MLLVLAIGYPQDPEMALDEEAQIIESDAGLVVVDDGQGGTDYNDGDGSYGDADYDARSAAFEQCVFDLLDPARNCLDLDSSACNPDNSITDETIFSICRAAYYQSAGQPTQFLEAAAAPMLSPEEEQKLRDKIAEIRAAIGKVAAIKPAAESLAALLLPGRYADGEQDALRHMIGTAMLLHSITDFFGARATALFGLNRRETAGTPAGDMDIANNNTGAGLLAGIPAGDDFLCALVIAALGKIKDGTAKVATTDADQAAKVTYWLEHLDELKQLLGCAGDDGDDCAAADGCSSSSSTSTSSDSSSDSSSSTSTSSGEPSSSSTSTSSSQSPTSTSSSQSTSSTESSIDSSSSSVQVSSSYLSSSSYGFSSHYPASSYYPTSSSGN